jgi:Cys-tRNA(Pro)/Cys-tRNA(Cys) deacylase
VSGRQAKTNAARFLDGLGTPYELLTCQIDPADLSAETAAVALGLPPEMVYKTLLLRGSDSTLLEACLPADRELDLKALAKAAGLRSAALAPLKELFPLTGYRRGGCSPFGGKRRFPLFVHEDVVLLDKMAVNAGAVGLMFLMKPDDFLRAGEGVLAPIVKI